MTQVPRHLGRRAVFIDTSAFFASTVRRDVNFLAAMRILERVESDGAALVTTTYLVAEAHALFLSKEGRHAAAEFLREFDNSATTLIRPTEADETRARNIIYRYADKSFSLADAVSFAVMERLGIATAFTFDSDFRQYGFAVAEG